MSELMRERSQPERCALVQLINIQVPNKADASACAALCAVYFYLAASTRQLFGFESICLRAESERANLFK